MKQEELLPHLFRTEFSKITTVLCKVFGFKHIEAAEDIASDTFLAAAESWTYTGIPSNPTAWLYKVAKNKAYNYLKRNEFFQERIAPELKHTSTPMEHPNFDLSAKNISDAQLQMLFAICHPTIPAEAQIGLSLRVLCGFGITEIADALLTNKETINKRLHRAREKLRSEKITFELPDETVLIKRLHTVLTTLYLLFNEGYYSESHDEVIRQDLCLEAMRLTSLLTENTLTNLPEVNALLALMCFHASRLQARKNKCGELILYDDQDESLWNHELISRGAHLLSLAATGNHLSKYHLEASIAYWMTVKTDTPEKWESVLQLYNQLLVIDYSPIAALNRTYAFAKVYGKSNALAEAHKLELVHNPFFHALLGELYTDLDTLLAIRHFEQAISLARNRWDKQILQHKVNTLLAS
jgi:RNA polymerase sigma factor (sigma-70 family)